MKVILIHLIDRFLDSLNRKKAFGFFYWMFLRGLRGIEHGVNYGDVNKSGERHVLKLLKQFSNPIIFDVGANKGQYATLAIEILGSNSPIFCFEPAKHSFEDLQKLQESNNVRLFNLALGNFTKRVELFYDKHGSGLASLKRLDYVHYNIGFSLSEEVSITRLDDFCKHHQINHIDLLKIDVEGMEMDVIQGAENMINNNNINMIQWEMGRPNVHTKIFFLDFFNSFSTKYNIFRILSLGLTQIVSYSYEYEIFLGCNYLAIHKSLKLDI